MSKKIKIEIQIEDSKVLVNKEEFPGYRLVIGKKSSERLQNWLIIISQ